MMKDGECSLQLSHEGGLPPRVVHFANRFAGTCLHGLGTDVSNHGGMGGDHGLHVLDDTCTPVSPFGWERV